MASIEAKKIVEELIDDLNDRRGCGIDGLDKATQKEIRDTWCDIVDGVLSAAGDRSE